MLTRSQSKLQEQNAALIEAQQRATAEEQQRATVKALKRATAESRKRATAEAQHTLQVCQAIKEYLNEFSKASNIEHKMRIATDIFRTFSDFLQKYNNDFLQKYDELSYGDKIDKLTYVVYHKVIEFENNYYHGAWDKISDSLHAPLREVMSVTKQLSSKYILNYSGKDLEINALKQILINQQYEFKR